MFKRALSAALLAVINGCAALLFGINPETLSFDDEEARWRHS